MISKYFLILLFASVLLLGPTIAMVNAYAFTQKDNEAKEEIFSSLGKNVNNSYSQYKNITASTHDNRTIVIYNETEAPPPPPPIKCPVDTVYNETSKKCEPIPNPPPKCPPGQMYNQTTQQCEDLPPNPPMEICGDGIDNNNNGKVDEGCPIVPPTPDKPATTFNTSSVLRVVAVADIDDNNGLTTQLNLAKKYHAQVLLIPGDYGYKSCPAVIDAINKAGFTKANALIAEGNHDCSKDTMAFNGMANTYGFVSFGDKLSITSIDANQKFDCSSSQYADLKQKLESSDAWYNIGMVHQQFVTGPSHHPANGQFNCYDPLFKANGVGLILQGHNHNYQRFDIGGITYLTVGTGTHDTTDKMYPIDAKAKFGSDTCQMCITGTNGITILDLVIDNPSMHHIHGWFLSNADTVMDKFHIGG